MARIKFFVPTISDGMLDACHRIIESNVSEDAVELAREIIRIAPEINALPQEIEKFGLECGRTGVNESKTGLVDEDPEE